MAIPSGLSSQIVCGPGVFFPACRSTFWCLFWVWGSSRTTWFPALNLTGIWTSILTHFWVTFLFFCRCYFQRFFAVFPDPFFSTFIENECVWGANGLIRRRLFQGFCSQSEKSESDVLSRQNTIYRASGRL